MLSIFNFDAFLKEYNNKNHVMIDIETLSTSTNTIVPQIAAVQFNPYTGEIFNRFDMKIDIQEMIDSGLEISASTLRFWLSQPKEAIDKVFPTSQVNVFPFRLVLQKFGLFLKECSSNSNYVDTRVWGNGPSFDLSKISSLYESVKEPKPWQYFNERCVRTIVAFNPDIKKNMVFEGVKHDGVDDSIHQTKYVSATLRSIVPPAKTEENVEATTA